jgi:hypothetical protein
MTLKGLQADRALGVIRTPVARSPAAESPRFHPQSFNAGSP